MTVQIFYKISASAGSGEGSRGLNFSLPLSGTTSNITFASSGAQPDVRFQGSLAGTQINGNIAFFGFANALGRLTISVTLNKQA